MVALLVAVGSVELETTVLPELTSRADVDVVRRCVDVADLVAMAATGQAEAALVALPLRGLDADAISEVADRGVVVIGLCDANAAGDRETLTRLGVRTVVSPEELAEVAVVISRAREMVREPGSGRVAGAEVSRAAGLGVEPRRRGRVVVVWGPAGAPGRSTVALGLAAESARLRVDSMLVDADVYGGSSGQQLGLLDESSGLLAACRAANVGGLDGAVLARHSRQVDDRLRVLTGLPRADRWIEVRPVLLRSVLDTCRELASLVVVDCGFSLERDEEISYDTTAPRRNGATIEALDRADAVIVVGAADPIGLSRLIRGLDELTDVLPTVAPYVVVNRTRPTLGWPAEEIGETVRRATGFPVMATLPDDPAACDKALVSGRSLSECAPDARLTRGLRSLAAALVGGAVPTGRVRWRTAARGR